MNARHYIFIALAVIGLGIGFRIGRQKVEPEVIEKNLPPAELETAEPSLTAIKKSKAKRAEPVTDWQSKLDEFRKIEDYMGRHDALSPVFRSWARSDPDAAFNAWAQTPEVAGMGFAYRILNRLHKTKSFGELLGRIREIQDPRSRKEAQRTLGGELFAAADRPAAADLLLSTLPEDELADPMSSAISSWRMKDSLETVWQWVESKSDHFDPDMMAQLERSAVSGLFASKPEKGVEWLLSRATDESRSGHLASIAKKTGGGASQTPPRSG